MNMRFHILLLFCSMAFLPTAHFVDPKETSAIIDFLFLYAQEMLEKPIIVQDKDYNERRNEFLPNCVLKPDYKKSFARICQSLHTVQKNRGYDDQRLDERLDSCEILVPDFKRSPFINDEYVRLYVVLSDLGVATVPKRDLASIIGLVTDTILDVFQQEQVEPILQHCDAIQPLSKWPSENACLRILQVYGREIQIPGGHRGGRHHTQLQLGDLLEDLASKIITRAGTLKRYIVEEYIRKILSHRGWNAEDALSHCNSIQESLRSNIAHACREIRKLTGSFSTH